MTVRNATKVAGDAEVGMGSVLAGTASLVGVVISSSGCSWDSSGHNICAWKCAKAYRASYKMIAAE